jgi:hypothetical protein
LENFRHPPIVVTAADRVLEQILREISVPMAVLEEAKRRRDYVREIAMHHPAARRTYNGGSVAQGTTNSPLTDADCGVVIDRSLPEFRAFGPDAGSGAEGPERFYQDFATFIAPRLRDVYPDVELDLDGNRAIKFLFNDPIEFDELGIVDPYVDLIVALRRQEDHLGLWIPNRRNGWWDPANPEKHTWLMTTRDPKTISVHRAHEVRLGKRALKREAAQPGRVQAVCSWNLSALSLDLILERKPLARGLAELLDGSATAISASLTEDPAGVAGPIALPDGMSQEAAAAKLAAMAASVWQAVYSRSEHGARASLQPLFGTELDAIRFREQKRLTSNPLHGALSSRDAAAVATSLAATVPLKPTASDGG